MELLQKLLLVLTLPIILSCTNPEISEPVNIETIRSTKTNLNEYQKAYFASGCFWCVEAIFQSVIGIEEVVSGYSGGKKSTANYQQVGAGLTDHAESVVVYYDSTVISYNTLLTVFFDSHDPSTLNQQGPDRGRQYRSAIFYEYPYQYRQARDYIDSLKNNKVFTQITTELTKLNGFYPAESYHQEYEKNHPNNLYVRQTSIPRINRFKSKHPELLKKNSH